MRGLVAAVIIALVAVGCATPPPTNSEPAVGVPALDFTADLVAGGQLSGADLAGGDVVLWFWAPW